MEQQEAKFYFRNNDESHPNAQKSCLDNQDGGPCIKDSQHHFQQFPSY